MDLKDMKAIKRALELSIRANADNLALVATIAKNGTLQLDMEFYEQERDRLIAELTNAVQYEINK